MLSCFEAVKIFFTAYHRHPRRRIQDKLADTETAP